jgi:predicted AlkP superfamily phosphohydrolase/phosphomutase
MSRLLVIGWDGGTWSVADPLRRDGGLPALSSLVEGGAHGVLQTVPNMNSAPAWSTIATGLNPGRHGIFYFDEPVLGTYRRSLVNAARRAGRSLWRLASDSGKRIVVVNVPISYPAERIDGYLVAGLDTPSKSLPGFTYPEGLVDRFPELFRDYIVEPEVPNLMRAGRPREAERALIDSVGGWASVTERLMEEEWDLVFVVFTSSDTAQHFFWAGQGRQVVERVYRSQDEATARLIAKARSQDPHLNVMVIADHGGAANTRGPEFMPIWLEDQGFQTRGAASLKERLMAAGFDLAARTLSREQKRWLAKRFPKLQQAAETESRLSGMDWGRTRAYSDGLRDEVLVNLAGREPEGTVAGAEYPGFVRDLQQAIAGIRELGTGRPVIQEVMARGDVYHGPHIDLAPDITIRWAQEGDAPFRGFECSSDRARERMREIASGAANQSGGHHPEGILVASGPNVTLGPARGRLVDVTPTILALIGAPVPADLDGRPLDMLRGVGVEVSGPAGESPLATTQHASGYTDEEEEAVRQRLEDLGYL